MIGRKSESFRNLFNVIMTGMLFLVVTILYKPVSRNAIELFIPDIMGTGLYLKLDIFRYIFVWITVFIWFLTTIYSTRYLIKYKNRNRYYAFFMLTLSSTIGIFLSEHLLNLFTFFEIMSFTSYILIIHDEDEYAHEAGKSYLGMAIGGGLVLLMGLFLLFDYTATLNISELPLKIKEIGSIKYLVSGLIIIGFGVKAGMVPLHVWLPKAHPAAPTPASAILSGILLKTGIFGILITTGVIMEGDILISTIILILGFINMFLGGLLAIFQRNIKRILAYSSMSQMGYILMGIGLIGILKEHKAVAIYGTIYHIINHAIYKGLLFLGAGIIYMILHDLSINEIRGFGKHKPILKAMFLTGIFAVIGIPGFNGFASKTLLHEALLEAQHIYHNGWFTVAEIVFILSSGLTVAYLLKIFIAVFVEQNEKYWGQYKHHIRKRVSIPLIILSGVIVYIGIRPNAVMYVIDGALVTFGLQKGLEAEFYTLNNIKASLLAVAIGVTIYIGFVRKYLRKQKGSESWYVNPSLGWLNIEKDIYSPVLKFVYRFSSTILHAIDQSVMNIVNYITNGIKAFSKMEIKYMCYKKLNIYKKMQLFSNSNEKNSYHLANYIHNISPEIYNVAGVLNKLRNSLNSMMYSVFIFATILVIVLLVLFL
jgi:hydrogenase-4 component B